MTTDKPSANMCVCFPNETSLANIPNVKWIDNRKDIFSVSVDAFTSIYAKDNYIDRFFDIYSKAEIGHLPRLYNGDVSTFERHLKETLDRITNANLKKIIHFLPIILDKLISLFLHPPVINNQLRTSNSNIIPKFLRVFFFRSEHQFELFGKYCQDCFKN